MKIANFREYISILREIYSREAMGETGSYYYALTNSGAELKKKKALLRQKIYHLSQSIKQQAQKIKNAKDKKVPDWKWQN